MKIDITKEIIFRTARSGGKGGQNVNKVETMVEGYFSIRDSSLFTEDEKNTLEKIGELLEEQKKLTELKLDEGNSRLIPYAEKYLNKIREILSKSLTKEEVNLFCQIQEDLTKKKQESTELQNQIQELEAKIEIPPK